MAPLLPKREALNAYLARIDANRWYSNFGPLCEEFAARIAAHYGAEDGTVCLASNATSALAAVMQELSEGRAGGLCLMPSWTFAATAHAACLAGLEPKFVDVDAGTGQLTPEIAERALDPRVAVVMPVSPFGAAVAPTPWAAFQQRHGIPVVIDAAAGFDTVTPSAIPTIVSLHTTKPVSAAEGGFLLSTDRDFVERIRRRTNFGFDAERASQYLGLNAKMSEYAAAIGLASLDAWPEERARLMAKARRYAARLSSLPLALQEGWGASWISTTLNVRLNAAHGANATELSRRLSGEGIDARLWWGRGCHTHPAFARFETAPLPNTERWVRSILGLPFHANLDDADMDEVVARLSEALDSGDSRRGSAL